MNTKDLCTIKQIELLSRFQNIGMFKNINPVSATRTMVDELFSKLPLLQEHEVSFRVQKNDNNFVDYNIIATSYNNLKNQVERLCFLNNWEVVHKSEPVYVSKEKWLDFLEQPINEVGRNEVAKILNDWNFKSVSKDNVALAFDVDSKDFEHLMDIDNRVKIIAELDQQLYATKEQRAYIRVFVDLKLMPPFEKKEYMELTRGQADELITKYMDIAKGKNIELEVFLKKPSQGKVLTLNDVTVDYFPEINGKNLTECEPATYEQKMVLRDLVKRGDLFQGLKGIQFLSKEKFNALSYEQAEKLINDNSSLDITYNQINYIKNLEDLYVGDIENVYDLSIKEGRNIILSADELDHNLTRNKNLKEQATPAQQKILGEMINSKVLTLPVEKIFELSKHQASALINLNIDNYNTPLASKKQKSILQKLAQHKIIEHIPLEKWQKLTVKEASLIISQNIDKLPEQAQSLSASSSNKPLTVER